jgi:HAD superfamily hydrolase (TIGR01490 family)
MILICGQCKRNKRLQRLNAPCPFPRQASPLSLAALFYDGFDTVSLAIFDLDHTLIDGDSDYEWGQFLIERHIVDGAEYERKNDRYYADYHAGTLDIFEFLEFALKPLSDHDRARLETWHKEFMQEKILPIIPQVSKDLIEKHRKDGDTLLIITATNSFVTRPIAELLGVHHLLATEPEVINGQYTGRVQGTPCFKEGKVERLHEWLKANNQSLAGSWFYSDSHNDLPLLNEVDHPVAVNPDDTLRAEAEKRHWPIIKLH